MGKNTVETDRELLELAARSFGLVVGERPGIGESWFEGVTFIDGEVGSFKKLGVYTMTGMDRDGPILKPWNPLQDDGDALRLAVKLGLEVYKGNDEVGDLTGVVYFIEGQSRPKVAMEYHKDHNDAFSATRRAITRAAAEMQLSKEDK